jgi:protein-S-isoprenylcysteine O-methyltransferase Ste14
VGPITDGQGPAAHGPGALEVRGAFTRTRNPLNAATVPVLWLAPRASAARLGFNVAATVYLVAGSRHTEQLLRGRHGRAFADYQASGVPFFVPSLGDRRRAP